MIGLNENETIKKAKQGDKSALLALYEQYTPLFKKLCRKRYFVRRSMNNG